MRAFTRSPIAIRNEDANSRPHDGSTTKQNARLRRGHCQKNETLAYLLVRVYLVPAAEHGREHAVAVGEGRARRGEHALAANVEVDGIGGVRVVVGHERGLAMPLRPVCGGG